MVQKILTNCRFVSRWYVRKRIGRTKLISQKTHGGVRKNRNIGQNMTIWHRLLRLVKDINVARKVIK